MFIQSHIKTSCKIVNTQIQQHIIYIKSKVAAFHVHLQ